MLRTMCCLFVGLFKTNSWHQVTGYLRQRVESVVLGTGHTYGPHPWPMTEQASVTASGTFTLMLSVLCNTQKQGNIPTNVITRRYLAR